MVSPYTESKVGAGSRFAVSPRIATNVNPGTFRFSERFQRLPRRHEWDAIMFLGAQMNHDYTTPNQDVINSWLWRGCTKKARSISKMSILTIFNSMDEPSSVDANYTEVQALVGLVDYGIDSMPDMTFEGVLAWGWVRNFYDAAEVASYNQLGQGTWGVPVALIGGIEALPRTVEYMYMSPKVYDYSSYGGIPTGPLLSFYHKSLGFGAAAKQAWSLFNIVAFVRFLASDKSIEHGE